MKLGETDPTLRRVGPLHVVTTLGDPVLGDDFSNATIEISVAGGAFAPAAGTMVEIGSGYYYYLATASDVSARPWITIRISGASMATEPLQDFTLREDITIGRQAAIMPGEVDPALLAIGPLRFIDDDGNELGAADIAGATKEITINGAALTAPLGTFACNDDGYLLYTADPSEVAADGWIALRISGTCQEFMMREDLGTGGFSTPTLTVLSTFAANFRDARLTPWEGTLDDFPVGAELVIVVRYSERNEVIVARDYEGDRCWPFDIAEDNPVDLESDPVTVSLLPRGGWPPCDVEIQLGAAVMAVE